MRRVVSALLVAAAVATGCVAEPTASERDQQVDWGEAVYQWHCARCHDADRSAVELTPEVLVEYDGAKELYEFNRDQMPLDEPGRLPDSDYWAVTAHLLDDAGLLDLTSDEVLDATTSDEGAGPADPTGDDGDDRNGSGENGSGENGSGENGSGQNGNGDEGARP
jgi:hypothetical protein